MTWDSFYEFEIFAPYNYRYGDVTISIRSNVDSFLSPNKKLGWENLELILQLNKDNVYNDWINTC